MIDETPIPLGAIPADAQIVSANDCELEALDGFPVLKNLSRVCEGHEYVSARAVYLFMNRLACVKHRYLSGRWSFCI